MKNNIFKTQKLPFVELRYISQVTSCDKKHQHEELILTTIKAGNINILFNEKTDSLKPNQISIVNPNEVHAATLSDVKSFGCYVLYLNKKWCKEIQKSLFTQSSFLNIQTSLIEDNSMYLEFISICDELFMNDISNIEKEEKLIELISKIFLKFCHTNEKAQLDTKNFKIANKIKDYLIANIENEISLQDIAEYMQLSTIHILRVFKKEFGLPIHSYILNEKVHLAKDLLSQNMPISEVAHSSGFFDQSHLNKSFKRVFQLTPKEYQKNISS
jgi:AraC-like DNA-binding protein